MKTTSRSLTTILLFLCFAGCATVNIQARLNVARDAKTSTAERIQAVQDLVRSDKEKPLINRALQSLLEVDNPQVAWHAKRGLRVVRGQDKVDFSRVAVVGASVSAGFGSTPFHRIFKGAIEVPTRIHNQSTPMFFISATTIGKRSIRTAVAFRATVVVAVDFLFWYVYVRGTTAYRSQRLAQALTLLEQVKAPLFLGDIPHLKIMPIMVKPEQIPSRQEIAQFNAQVHQWARRRLNVEIIPIAQWSAPLRTGACAPLAPSLPPVRARKLMNRDGLHPNRIGSRYLIRKIAALIYHAYPSTLPGAIKVPVTLGKKLPYCPSAHLIQRRKRTI
jgi:hypothetical protein